MLENCTERLLPWERMEYYAQKLIIYGEKTLFLLKAYRPLRVELEEDKLLVNGKVLGLKDYRLFSNLILLFLEDDACVVLPQRVFGKEQANLRQVLDHLDRYLIK